jgi:hypothetical protein
VGKAAIVHSIYGECHFGEGEVWAIGELVEDERVFVFEVSGLIHVDPEP